MLLTQQKRSIIIWVMKFKHSLKKLLDLLKRATWVSMTRLSKRSKVMWVILRNLNYRMDLNFSSQMLCWSVTKYQFSLHIVQKIKCLLEIQWALLSWCFLRKPLGRGPLQRHRHKSRGLKRHLKLKRIWIVREEGYLRIPFSTERARWGGSATILSRCFIRRSLIPFHNLWMGRSWKTLNRRSGIRWPTMRWRTPTAVKLTLTWSMKQPPLRAEIPRISIK